MIDIDNDIVSKTLRTPGGGWLDTFISETLGLTKLPAHLPTFVLSTLAFLLVHQVVAPWASTRWFPAAYASKGRGARNNWAIHVVSQVHVVIVVPLALWVLSRETEERERNRAFGWAEDVGFVHAIACGYFLWDTWDAIVNFIDLGFVIHGVACLAIYTMSFKPFVAYYGTRCLLWETSTFFLNIHWFMDKTGHTGGRAQLINGVFLLSAFFGVRIVYGGKVSYDFVHTLIQVRHEIPGMYIAVYGLGNVVLQALNWLWFYKMISALRKRFATSEGKPLLPRSENGHPQAREDGEQDRHHRGNGHADPRQQNGQINGASAGYGST